MIPLKLSIKGDFARRLEERAAKWAGRRIAARVRVPPELKWWYYQEFGTRPYIIEPKEAIALVFPTDYGIVMRSKVHHPGIEARRPVQKVEHGILERASEICHEAIVAGALDNPGALQAAVLEATREAKEAIAVSFAELVPGSRPVNLQFPKQSGKLLGRTAAEVIRKEAEVVDLSS